MLSKKFVTTESNQQGYPGTHAQTIALQTKNKSEGKLTLSHLMFMNLMNLTQRQ